MSFNPNIPQPADLLSNSQVDLLANNIALNAIFSRNHTAYNVALDSGKHKFVEMVRTTTTNVNGPIPTPAPGLTTGTGTFYTGLGIAGNTQLFYSNGNTGNVYQLTTATDASYSSFGVDPTGWTFLPGGLVLAYGRKNNPTNTGSFNYGFTFSSIVSVSLTARNDGSHSAFNYWIDGAPGLTSLSYQGSTTGSQALYYMILGFA